MIPELGHFALALAVAIAGAQAVLSLLGAHNRDARLMAAAPALALGQLIALVASFGCLIISAVTDDFSVYNVAQYSSSIEPLFYKITGTWGNHEGSILLWCLILALCSGVVAAFGRNLPSALRARVIGVLGFTSAGFLLFALTASNPFTRVWPPPVEGASINPLLQDPGLAMHPPILYAGYVGFAIPFAFAVAALLEGRVDAAWGRWVRPWTLAAWCLLTCGIALGSWWSYYVLGWGGYWFWDPVENASLLPWLTGAALLHSAIVVEKREALKIWTVLLAIGTFSLSLSGTFLVRSGLLNSVHTFASDPTRGVFILALLAIVIGGSLLLFALRAPILSPAGLFAPVSREGGIVLNNILLCSICAVVLTGTMYPPMAELLFGAKLSVGPPYFHDTGTAATRPALRGDEPGADPALEARRSRRGADEAVVGGGGGGNRRHRRWSWTARRLRRARLHGGRLVDPRGRRTAGRAGAPVPRALERLARAAVEPAPGVWGAAIAHAGLGVTIAGIGGMALAASSVVALAPGQTVAVGGYEWTLLGMQDAPGPDYTARIADLRVTREGQVVTLMHPSRHSFTAQRQTISDAAIVTNGMRDLYAVLGDERDGKIVLRLHVNLMAPWIWFGALVMALGGALSLADRRLRVGAPARRRAPQPAPAE